MVHRYLFSPLVLFALTTACTRPNDDGPGGAGDATDGSGSTASGSSTTVTPSSDPATSGSSDPQTTTDPTTEGMESGTGEATGSSTGVGYTCEGAGMRCVGVPDGWEGPVARLVDDDAPGRPSCGGDFPISTWSGFANVSDPGLICGCECDDPAGGACASNVFVDVYDVDCTPPTCNSANLGTCAVIQSGWDDVIVGQAGSASFLDAADGGLRLTASEPVTEAAPTCAELAEVNIPDVEPTGYRELCEMSDAIPETCPADQICTTVPSNPFTTGVCVWNEGNIGCPEELGYTVRSVLHANFDDTRSCSDCTCGPAQNVECDGDVSVTATYSEGAGLVFDAAEFADADGTCSQRFIENGDPVAGVNFIIDYEAPDPTSSGCNPSGGEPSGDVTPVDTITVCCTED